MTAPIPLPAPGAISLENWGIPLTQRVNSLVAAGIPRGFVAEAFGTATTTATSATEVFHITLTFATVAGRRYEVNWDGNYAGSAGGNLMQIRTRYAVGNSVTSGGTLLRSKQLHAVASVTLDTGMNATFVSATTGNYTIGVSIALAAGAGNVSVGFSASNQTTRMAVYDCNV